MHNLFLYPLYLTLRYKHQHKKQNDYPAFYIYIVFYKNKHITNDGIRYYWIFNTFLLFLLLVKPVKTTDTNGGYSVGWTQPGEWLEYQLNTKKTDSYKIVGRFATPKINSKINVWLNGVKVKSNVTIASTGGHQNWQNQVLFSGRNLTKGTNTLRIEVVTGGFNMNWFKFSAN